MQFSFPHNYLLDVFRKKNLLVFQKMYTQNNICITVRLEGVRENEDKMVQAREKSRRHDE